MFRMIDKELRQWKSRLVLLMRVHVEMCSCFRVNVIGRSVPVWMRCFRDVLRLDSCKSVRWGWRWHLLIGEILLKRMRVVVIWRNSRRRVVIACDVFHSFIRGLIKNRYIVRRRSRNGLLYISFALFMHLLKGWRWC